MELKEYVCQTIVQICQGVKEAQKECAEMGAIVNPDVTIGTNGEFCIPKKTSVVNIVRRVQMIDIDAMLTDSSNDSSGVGVGLSVNFLGVKFGGDQTTGKTSTNHVHFSVPVALPSVEVKDESMPTPSPIFMG